MKPLSESDPLKPYLEVQQTQKQPTSSNPTASLVSESAKSKFHEQQLQDYRARHKKNITQQNQQDQQGLEQMLALGRQKDFKKAIEETEEFLSVSKSYKETETYFKARLVYAVGTGNIELLKICCKVCNDNGIDAVNQSNIPGFPAGFTPLMLVASRPIGDISSLELLKILLENRADTNAIDSKGMMALDYLEGGLILSWELFEPCKTLLIKIGSMSRNTTPELYETAHKEWKGWKLRHQGETLEGVNGCENVENAAHVYKWVFNHILACKKTSNPERGKVDSELTFQEAAQIIGFCMKSWKWTPTQIDDTLKQGKDFIERNLIGSLIGQAGRDHNWSMVMRLLEAGVDRDNDAFMQLFKSLGDPPYEIVKAFAKCCDVTKRDGEGNTALMRAIYQNKSLHEEEYERSYDPEDYTHHGSLYSEGYYEANNLQVIEFLLAVFKKQPALMNASNTLDETAFTLAKESYSRIVTELFSDLEKSETSDPAQESI